jgi:hypothetical protein
MSWIELSEGEPAVTFRKSEFLKCERSRLRRPDVSMITIGGEQVPLTLRDKTVLEDGGLLEERAVTAV